MPANLPVAYKTLADACQPGEPVSCPREAFLRGVEEAALTYEAAEICRIDLQECQETVSIDQALCAGQVEKCTSQRWLWAVGGLVLGVVLAGSVAGMIGR